MKEITLGVQAPDIDTGWANPPKLSDLKGDLQEALPYHTERVTAIQTWLDNLHVRNGAKVSKGGTGSKVVPRLIRKQAEWRYPALSEPFLSTEDIFKVSPTTWEDREAARQNQMVLNYQFNNQINKQLFIDKYVRAAVDAGVVLMRPGWCYADEEIEEEVPVFEYVPDERFGQIYEQLLQLRNTSPSQFQTDVPQELQDGLAMSEQAGLPLAPMQVGYGKQKRVKVLKNHPTVTLYRAENVIIDPTCEGDISKASFAIFKFKDSLSGLAKQKLYKNLEYVDVSSASPLSSPDSDTTKGPEAQYNFGFKDNPRKKLDVYEYWGFWDIHGTGEVVSVVVAWVGDTIIRMEENPFPDKQIPLITVAYLPMDDTIYGESDGALLEENQKILGAVTRGMIDLLGKSANSQIGYSKNLFDATNRRKFERGEDYEFNPNVNPEAAIHMHRYPEIPQSALLMAQLQQQEAESLTGVKSYHTGIGAAALGDVAAGIRGALDAASKRELGILRRLAAGVVELGKRIISMNGVFLSDTEVVRITNEEFVEVSRDSLVGNFDIKLNISTAEENNNKAQDLGFMLQTAGGNMDPSMYQLILADIARLKRMPDLAERIENFQPQPNEQQQQLQQLELQKAQLEVAKLQAEIQATIAGASLSEAQAAKLQATVDKMSLDFVEQESGVTQERKRQLVGEQARSQMELVKLKHGLDKETRMLDILADYQNLKSSGRIL